MHTVNERAIAAPASAVGALLDSLASDDDALWPATSWPALRLDRPLGVGAAGGHGPVRYAVAAYEPGRRVRFAFTPRFQVDGYHELTVEPDGDGTCRLRDIASGRARRSMRLAWPLVWHWLHDALMEDLLDRAEAAATGQVQHPARWSLWVRVLRRLLTPRAREVPVPAEATLLRTAFPGRRIEDADLLDAWSAPLAPGVAADPAAWADAMFRDQPRWVTTVLRLRNAVVGLFGINRSDVSAFDTRSAAGPEVLLGEDDTHLDFRASILVSPRTVTVSTVAYAHNRRGRFYLVFVRLGHPVIVRAMLARASRRLTARAVAAALQPPTPAIR